MTRYLTRISLVARLRIGFGLFLLPVALMSVVFYNDSSTAMNAVRLELRGVQYLNVLYAVQDKLLDGAAAPDGPALADRIKSAELAFGTGIGVTDQARRIETLLRPSNPADAVSTHAAIIELIEKVADGSGLTLDTDLDSFYLMDAVVNHMPVLADAVADLAVLTRTFASRPDLTPEMQVTYLLREGKAAADLDQGRAALETSFKANASGNVAKALGGTLGEAANKAARSLASLRSATLVERIVPPSAEGETRETLGAIARLRDAAVVQLSTLLELRLTGLWTKLLTVVAAAAGIFVIAAGFVAIAISREGVGPLRIMTNVMGKLAAGDLTVLVPGQDRRDELGEMARALLVFRDNAEKARALGDAAEQAQAEKDQRQATIDRQIANFGTSTARVMEGLSRAAEGMRTRANDMGGIMERTRALAGETAEGTTTSAQNLAAVASATEEMSASINEIGQQVSRAAEAVRLTVDQAKVTDTKVTGLAVAADKVGDVVRLISDIAGQTNLLALNATIEAARAGDAGKGFAVVAGEVKALAAQTARATEEIGAQILAIRGATGEAVAAVRDVTAAIGEVNEVAGAIAAAVEEQGAVTRDIVLSVQTATVATQRATQAMQDVSDMSEAAAKASREVLAGAGEVGTTAETLRDEVTRILAAM
jgi:methyl-accepting chemotaxis protein